MADQLERDPVTVVEDPGLSPRRQRVGSTDILAAIRALPDAVAARLDGREPRGGDADGDEPAEVTFVGDPPPAPSPEPAATGAGSSSPAPVVHRATYHHPSKKRRRSEAMA
jgi:hypothetical protein